MTTSPSDPPLAWDLRPGDSTPFRFCTYLALAPLLGLFLLSFLAFLVLLPSLDLELLVLLGLLALVGGPASLLYLWPLLADPEQRPGLGLPGLSPAGVGLATVAGALAHAVALWTVPYGPLALLVLGPGVALPLASTAARAGRIDPDALTMTLEYPGELLDAVTVDMTDWTALRRVRLGPVVVLWPTLARGGTAPRPLVVPADVAAAAAPAFERAVAAPVDGPTREPNAAVAATLAAFGLGAVALGGALWQFVALPTGIRLWLVTLCAFFGGLFLFLAWRERYAVS